MIFKWLLKRFQRHPVNCEKAQLDLSQFKGTLRRDKADKRDYVLEAPVKAMDLPKEVDLREWAPEAKQQGYIGSCGSQAYLSAYELLLKKNHPDWFIEGSELYHYYYVRKRMDTFPQDSGQTLREGAKTLKYDGFCPEALAPYDPSEYNKDPSVFARSFAKYIYGKKFPVRQYSRMWSIDAMKQAVAAGLPVVFGVWVFDSFLSYRSGIYKTPSSRNLGGHAMLIVGYSNRRNAFLVLNSWGTRWGMQEQGYKGYCWLHYDYVRKHLIDAWTIEL